MACPQMSASWSFRSDSWNVDTRQPPSQSWTNSRAPLSPDRCRDERWEVEWSSFLRQWGPQSVPVRRNWDGRPATEWASTKAPRAERWGAQKWKPQATSTWVEPRTPQDEFKSASSCLRESDRLPSASSGSLNVHPGSCLRQKDRLPSAGSESLDMQPGSYWDRPRQSTEVAKEATTYASVLDDFESDEESEDSLEEEGVEIEDVFRSTSRTEAYKKDEELDDASTQAGTTLASRSAAAESCGEATQLDDDQCDEALDDDIGLSDAESLPSSGAVGSTEEEFETPENTHCSETPALLAAVFSECSNQDMVAVEGATTKQACVQEAGSESVVVSAGSWAARQRLRQMERERAGASSVAIEDVDAQQLESQQLESQQVRVPSSFEHDKSGANALESSPLSWAAQARLRRAEREEKKPEQLSPEDIARKAKSLLNKLTEERFESLCQQICALPVHTSEQLAALVAEIFDKATTEKGFCTLYTELCARLDAHLLQEGSCVGGKVFRKALVTECQASFERNLQQPLDLKTLVHLNYEERYIEEVKHKTQTLGNMRFIGELLVRKLLAGKILFFIVNEMLDINSEASLESLIQLLSIVAPPLEKKGAIYEAPIREMFGSLRKKSKDLKLSMRIRCKMNDLLDLRSRGWVDRAVNVSISSGKAGAVAGASRSR